MARITVTTRSASPTQAGRTSAASGRDQSRATMPAEVASPGRRPAARRRQAGTQSSREDLRAATPRRSGRNAHRARRPNREAHREEIRQRRKASECGGSLIPRCGLPCSGSRFCKGDAARSPLGHVELRQTPFRRGRVFLSRSHGERSGDRASLRTRAPSIQTTDDATRSGRSPAPASCRFGGSVLHGRETEGRPRRPTLRKENREDASTHGSRSDPKTDSLTSAEQEPHDLSTRGVE
jgi:hypothetical protein